MSASLIYPNLTLSLTYGAFNLSTLIENKGQ